MDSTAAPPPTPPAGADAGDIAIRPGALVRVLASPSECPLFVKVLRVYSDDTLKVCLPYAPEVAWRLGVEDVALVLVPECVELEATG